MCETDMLLLAAALGAAVAGGAVPRISLETAERRDSDSSHDRAGGRSGD